MGGSMAREERGAKLEQALVLHINNARLPTYSCRQPHAARRGSCTIDTPDRAHYRPQTRAPSGPGRGQREKEHGRNVSHKRKVDALPTLNRNRKAGRKTATSLSQMDFFGGEITTASWLTKGQLSRQSLCRSVSLLPSPVLVFPFGCLASTGLSLLVTIYRLRICPIAALARTGHSVPCLRPPHTQNMISILRGTTRDHREKDVCDT